MAPTSSAPKTWFHICMQVAQTLGRITQYALRNFATGSCGFFSVSMEPSSGPFNRTTTIQLFSVVYSVLWTSHYNPGHENKTICLLTLRLMKHCRFYTRKAQTFCRMVKPQGDRALRVTTHFMQLKILPTILPSIAWLLFLPLCSSSQICLSSLLFNG